MATSQDVLIMNILKELGDEDFKEFKLYLGAIPKSKLEKADRADTSVKIKETYPETALEIIMNILKEINRNDLVQRYSFTGPPSKAETRADQTEDTTGRGGRGHENEGASAEPGVQAKPGKISLAEFHRLESELVKSGSPSVYKLPLKMNKIYIDGCKSYSFGKESRRYNRTIMMFGATRAGKTTLINGMINYILGINWNDDYRFRLFNEAQAESQVIVYKINHQEGFQIPYSLSIIDTPGFSDSEERNREITEQIHRLFTSLRSPITELDTVCFVTQAYLAKLTCTEKYVFDSLLSIIGRDIAENIRILVTFANSQQPPVLEVINASNVPCPKTEEGLPIHFKFNNTALFADNRSLSKDCDEECYWNMGMESLKHFFAALDKMETKSLVLTKEVLKERRRLEIAVDGLQPQIKAEIAKLAIRLTKQKICPIENFEEDIADLQRVILSLVEHSNEYLNRLNEIALRPNPLSTTDYIDLLIEEEKSEAKEGYMTRIRSLEAVKKLAKSH